jgi:hypothetical protein
VVEATVCRGVHTDTGGESALCFSADDIRINMTEKHPSHMLWELRQYLNRMNRGQTVCVKFEGDILMEYGFTDGFNLGSKFAELGYKAITSLAMAELGIDPFRRGVVYAYIEQRNPAFVHSFYGWGIER